MKKIKLLFIPFLAISFLVGCNAVDPGPTYNITYLNLIGSVTDNPTTYKTVDSFVLKNPTDHGYKFTGWRIDNAQGELVSEIKKGTTGDLKLFATWGEPNTYSINYTNLNGSTTTNPTSYTISDSFTLSDPTDHGYEFIGWRLDDAAGFHIRDIEKGMFGNLTLYASWGNANTYSITYKNVDGVEFENPNEYNIENEVKLNNPTTLKKGYNAFGGWYFDEAYTKHANNGWTPGSHYGNLTLYAKWVDPIVYKITYLNVQDSEHSNHKEYTIDDEVVLKNANKAGYTFVNWTLNSKTGDAISKIEKGTTGDLLLYANFTVRTYSITYRNLGLATTDNPKKFVYNVGVNKLNNPTSDSGYEFLGWRLGSATGETITKIAPNKYAGNIEIYASWGNKKTYTIEYDLWDGTIEGSNPAEYTVEDEIILKKPTQEGFTFVGWYLGKYKDKLFNKDRIPKKTVGNLKLYAGWKSATTTLEQCSWNRINEIANTEKAAAKYFNIGDKKTVAIGSNSLMQDVRIIGFNHDILSNSVNNEESRAGITFEFVDLLTVGDTKTKYLYSIYWGDPSCENYANSYIYGKCNDIFNEELCENDLKDNIKMVKKKAQNKYQSIGAFDVKVFPLALSEISTNTSDVYNEGEMYAFYKQNSSLVKKFTDKAWRYWLRSASKTYGTYAFTIEDTGAIKGRRKDDTEFYARGISPGFCI